MLPKMTATRRKRRLERLALIKERYRLLVLQPRQQIEMEIADEFAEEMDFDLN